MGGNTEQTSDLRGIEPADGDDLAVHKPEDHVHTGRGQSNLSTLPLSDPLTEPPNYVWFIHIKLHDKRFGAAEVVIHTADVAPVNSLTVRAKLLTMTLPTVVRLGG